MNLSGWEVGDTILRDGQHRSWKRLIGKDEKFSLGYAELEVRGGIQEEGSSGQPEKSWGRGE